MVKIKIDKKVPMPQGRGGNALWETFPFDEMEVGDSFYVEGKKGPALSGIIQSYKRARWLKDKAELKFTCRSDAKGCRIWRTQ